MDEFDEALTPAQSELAVKRATNKVAFCTTEYRRAGDELIRAAKEHRIAYVRAAYSPDIPTPNRAEGVTVGAVERFLKKAIATQADELFAAETNRDTALEALRSARSELVGATAINASVREAYKVTI